jgi:hypothetical protein
MQTGNQSVDSGGPNQTREKPALVEAIDFTLRTIETRARLYRNVLVAVALVSVASVLASLIGWRVWPLAGLILIVPLAGGFLFLDCRRVRRWHEAILEMCSTRGLDSAVFLQTLAQFKHVPVGSLHGMLNLLSARETPASVQQAGAAKPSPSQPVRAQEWRILTATVVLTLACACAVMAAWRGSLWLSAFAAGLIVVVVFLRRN